MQRVTFRFPVRRILNPRLKSQFVQRGIHPVKGLLLSPLFRGDEIRAQSRRNNRRELAEKPLGAGIFPRNHTQTTLDTSVNTLLKSVLFIFRITNVCF